MASDSNNQELIQAITSLKNSITILYSLYAPYLKGILLIILAYLSFKIGKISIRDQIDSKVKDLKKVLQERAKYTVFLPRKLEKIKYAKKLLFGIFLFLTIPITAAHFLKVKAFKTYYGLQIGGAILVVIFLILLSMQLYTYYLEGTISRGKHQQLRVNEKVNDVLKTFGNKVSNLLKIELCREKILKRPRSQANICEKKNCQELRGLYQSRYESIMSLVDEVLNFQWCTICRKRPEFNELLSFESQNFINESQNDQSKEVNARNIFLEAEIERMTKWVKEAQPCNCSKLYWTMSTKEVLAYKRVEKGTEERLNQLITSQKSIKSPSKLKKEE